MVQGRLLLNSGEVWHYKIDGHYGESIVCQCVSFHSKKNEGSIAGGAIMARLFLTRHALEYEWLMRRSTSRYPSVCYKTHGPDSEFWSEKLFDGMVRFRRMHFLRMIAAVGLRGKPMFC